MTADGEGQYPSLEEVFQAEAELEDEVETTLEALQERGLIEWVGEQDRLGPPLEPGHYGTTDVWEPTVEGRAEARAIRDAYSTEVQQLVESHGGESGDIPPEIVSVAKKYGILPDLFG